VPRQKTASSWTPQASAAEPRWVIAGASILCVMLVAGVPEARAQSTTGSDRDAGQATQNPPDAAPDNQSAPEEAHSSSRIVWHGFGDVGWQKTNLPGAADTFSLGQLTLYPTASISDRISVLAEIVLKEGGPNRVTVDLERVLLRYSFAESLAVSVGRYHTAIGYYNTAYHHSSWLQTTIERPLPFAFKGPLPIHDVGVSAAGAFTMPAIRLEYAAEVGNGRSGQPDIAVQSYQDDNGAKAVNVAVAVVPKAIPDLRVGASIYRDSNTPIGSGGRTESVIVGYVVYTNPVFEFLNEALVMRLATTGAASTTSPAFYSQISRAFGRLRPYARFEYLDLRAAATPGVLLGRRTTSLAGVRFDLIEMAALKLEYGRRRISPTTAGHGFAANVSFAF